ncbi:MAG TPA: type I restriction-modification system subunit M, partial [Rectinema sp.]|nr:type I restriction-modification system subunit M [Rectinema sp.]
IERKDEDYFTRLVPNSEIAENDYNIAVSSYVIREDTSEEVDIEKLNAHIAEIVIKQNHLRAAIDEIVSDLHGSE